MKQIAKVGEPPRPTAIPMHYRWVNTQKRRYYNLYVDYDLLGDLILLTTWGSLDTHQGGKKSVLVTDLASLPNLIKIIFNRRAHNAYQLQEIGNNHVIQ